MALAGPWRQETIYCTAQKCQGAAFATQKAQPPKHLGCRQVVSLTQRHLTIWQWRWPSLTWLCAGKHVARSLRSPKEVLGGWIAMERYHPSENRRFWPPSNECAGHQENKNRVLRESTDQRSRTGVFSWVVCVARSHAGFVGVCARWLPPCRLLPSRAITPTRAGARPQAAAIARPMRRLSSTPIRALCFMHPTLTRCAIPPR